uniref:Uncharacterized protein n=1 Tax=Acrobeloides nanus TaxID=290746 RepID=A0A914E3E2_9BILA
MNVLTTILALNRSDVMIGFLPTKLSKNNLLFKILLYLSYISTVVVTIIYLIPGLQTEVRGLTTIREDNNKKYVYPTILFTSFGLFVISYLLYLAAGIKVVMLNSSS